MRPRRRSEEIPKGRKKELLRFVTARWKAQLVYLEPLLSIRERGRLGYHVTCNKDWRPALPYLLLYIVRFSSLDIFFRRAKIPLDRP